MRNAPKFTLIGSGIVMVIGIVLSIIGIVDISEIDIEEDAIFKGTSGTVSVEPYGTYTVFVDDHYTCYDANVTVTDDTKDYFSANCDSDFDEVGWRAIGTIESDIDGDLSVEANHEILIIDDYVYAEEGGFALLGGGGICCCGIIGLIIGIILAITMKEQTPTQIVVMPGHGEVQMQQPAAVVPATTVPQPGNIIISQQEEGPGV